MIALLNEVSSGILDTTGETSMSVLDRLLTGLKLFAIGMITVFFILFLIIFVIKLVSLIIEKSETVKLKKKIPVVVEQQPLLVDVDDSEEIAAVMAAINVVLSSETMTSNVGFKVRSIKSIINK